jgi:hypothetical protein
MRTTLSRHLAPILMCLAACATAQADARDELVSAFGKAFERESYRIEVESAGSRGGRATIDFQLPDRFHMRSDEGEFIIHPRGTWARYGGQWTKVPMDMSAMVSSYAQPTREEAERKLGDVTRVGEEDVRGCPSILYRYRTEEGDAVAAVCRRSGFPVRIQTEGGGEPVTLYYDFDARIDIQPPN